MRSPVLTGFLVALTAATAMATPAAANADPPGTRASVAEDVYCQYRTVEGGHMLTPNWSQGDWLAAGTIVVHVTGTVVNGYRAITVSGTGINGWWGQALQRTSAPCWT